MTRLSRVPSMFAEIGGVSRALLLLLALGTAVTVTLTLIAPERTEFLGVYWVILGAPWSLLLHALLLIRLWPDNGYVNLSFLVLCVLANVLIVHILETAWRRSRAKDHQ